MQGKVPKVTRSAETESLHSARRSPTAAETFSAHQGLAASQTRPMLPLQRVTANSARTKQINSMNRMRDGGANGRGLPLNLKNGIESLSGISMDGITVHYNSSQPAKVQAHAFAQGTDIHLGPGQEAHLPHEAWHVVQQAQGRVAATMQMAGAGINDDGALEREADVMGARALDTSRPAMAISAKARGVGQSGSLGSNPAVLQRKIGMEIELNIPFYGRYAGPIDFTPEANTKLIGSDRQDLVDFLFGTLEYGTKRGDEPGKYKITADTMRWEKFDKLNAHIRNRYIERNVPGTKSMSNMEYVTEPVDETAPDDKHIYDIATSITTHATSSAALAKQEPGNLPSPVDDFRTGIPMQALTHLLAGDDTGTGFQKDMYDNYSPDVYYQTTIGVLPREIPRLFHDAATLLDDSRKEVENQSGFTFSDMATISGLLKASKKSAEQTMQEATNPEQFSPFEKEALEGWLTLIAQYLIASHLELTNFAYHETLEKDENGQRLVTPYLRHAKNLVGYLSRVSLAQTITALPESVRSMIDSRWNALLDTLLSNCRNAVAPLIFEINSEIPIKGGVRFPNLTSFEGRNTPIAGNSASADGKESKQLWQKITPNLVLFLTNASRTEEDPYINWLNGLVDDAKNSRFSNIRSVMPSTNFPVEEITPNNRIASGEKLILLEDRYATLKNGHDKKGLRSLVKPEHIRSFFMTEFSRARTRRNKSLEEMESRSAPEAKESDFDFDVEFDLPTPEPQSGQDMIAPQPVTESKEIKRVVEQSPSGVNSAPTANGNGEKALKLLKDLISDPRWSAKGKSIFGKVPDGIKALRAEVLGDSPASLENLRSIARARLGVDSSNRAKVTTDLYELIWNTPELINGDMKAFEAKYAKTQAGLK